MLVLSYELSRTLITGHDDAIAILMALYEPTIELIGLSTVSHLV